MTEVIKLTQDVPVAEAKAEGQKLEWRREWLLLKPWLEVQQEIVELNSKLTEGEKPWRFPTVDELLAYFNSEGKIVLNDNHRYLYPNDTQDLWATSSLEDPDFAFYVSMTTGRVAYDHKSKPTAMGIFVRDVA